MISETSRLSRRDRRVNSDRIALEPWPTLRIVSLPMSGSAVDLRDSDAVICFDIMLRRRGEVGNDSRKRFLNLLTGLVRITVEESENRPSFGQ